MATIKYIGRTTDFKGKTLWQIVSNLKNFGVGRVVVRQMFERYEEKSYMKIVKVEALEPYTIDDNTQRRQCNVWVEKVFRGKKFDHLVNVRQSSYKADFQLLSKKEEAEYCKEQQREEKIIAPYMELPPLLKEFVMKETGRKDVQMKVHHKKSKASMTSSRLAKEGETPNIVVVMGLGKPHPKGASLYEGIEL